MNNTIDLVELTKKIYEKVIQEVNEAYISNSIDEVLKKYGLQDEEEYAYYDINRAKILVVGNSEINKDVLIAVAKQYGIKENRLEFILDYDRLTNYNFGGLENSLVYSDVLVGPMPHSVSGIDGSSFLAMVQNNPENYPKVIKLCSANELKITKESFKKGLLETRLYNDSISE